MRDGQNISYTSFPKCRQPEKAITTSITVYRERVLLGAVFFFAAVRIHNDSAVKWRGPLIFSLHMLTIFLLLFPPSGKRKLTQKHQAADPRRIRPSSDSRTCALWSSAR